MMAAGWPRSNRTRTAEPQKRLSLSESDAGMKPIVNEPEPRLQHVRVDLRGGKVRMAQHHLDRPQIGAAFEQVRGKRVAHDVRAERAREVRAQGVAFENLPESDAAQRFPAGVEKQAR